MGRDDFQKLTESQAEDPIREALHRLNRILSVRYECRVFYRSRGNLAIEAPTLLHELDTLCDGPGAKDLGEELILPYHADNQNLGYFVLINGAKLKEKQKVLELLQTLAFEIVRMHHKNESLNTLETNIVVNHSERPTNVIYFRQAKTRLFEKLEGYSPLSISDHDSDFPMLILPERYPFTIQAPDSLLILRAALLAHEMLGGYSFVQQDNLDLERTLHWNEWQKLENQTIFCPDLTEVDVAILVQIQSLTKQFSESSAPQWIGGIVESKASANQIQGYNKLFPHVFRIDSPETTSQQIKEDLENFFLMS